MIGLRLMIGALRSPHLRASLQLRRDARAFVRLQFLGAGLTTGLLPLLREPASADELAAALDVVEHEMLRTFLDLGVALKELARTPRGYRVRGRLSRALVAADGEPLAANVIELVDYHGLVYRDLLDHLRSACSDYLAQRADLIACSSRLVEPVLGAFVRSLVRGGDRTRILEIGCGSGVYLRHAAEAAADASGVGIDVEPSVVAAARASLERWGIAHRFAVQCGDGRRLPPEVSGPFDLVTLYNNIYYLEPAERAPLFRSLRERIAPNGHLVVVSMTRGATFTSLDLSLALAATRGCTALPEPEDVVADLRRGGFRHVRQRALLPGEPLVAFVAHDA